MSSRPVIFSSCPASRNGGRGRTTFCRPVRSFSKVARQVGIKDEDGRHPIVPSRLFLNLPDKKNSGTRMDEIVSSPSSHAVRRLPLFSVVFRFFPPSPAVPRRPPSSPAVLHHPLPSPITSYKHMSRIVGFVVLPNDDRPGNSRTRTDGILSSRPVIFSSCPTNRSERRGRTTFCRSVSSRALGSPPAGPYGGPARLRTLIGRLLFKTIVDKIESVRGRFIIIIIIIYHYTYRACRL